MRYIVVLADLDSPGEWYGPLVEAPDPESAEDVVLDDYSNCLPVCVLDKAQVWLMLEALRRGQPDYVVSEGSAKRGD